MQLPPPPINHSKSALTAAFTLIEMSVVLVIIGLIVGGVLVGQDLIKAAEIRAQVAQIEKYNTAVNTFKVKYGGYLPGDIPDPYASQFGFVARGAGAGQGDGNGVIEGIWCCGSNGYAINTGETGLFWRDLSTAGFIGGNFVTATATANFTVGSTLNPGLYFPPAQIGTNYVYVYSGGLWPFGNGLNYFGLSYVTGQVVQCQSCLATVPAITVQQAYNIDVKVDDGMPTSGRVQAFYMGLPNGVQWAAGGGNVGTSPGGSATPSANTCYDNGSNSSNTMKYSTGYNGGNGINCALSFRFQ